MGRLRLGRQRRKVGFTSWLGSGLRWEQAELRVLGKGKLGRLSLPRREQRGGDRGVCRACACELRRARVLSLAQCDVGRGGWSRELYFPPSPSRSPPSPATPPSLAQPPAAICITKARRSEEEKGRGERLSPRPRGHRVAALTSLRSYPNTSNRTKKEILSLLALTPPPSSQALPSTLTCALPGLGPPPYLFARLGAHLPLRELLKNAPPIHSRRPARTHPTSGIDRGGLQSGGAPMIFFTPGGRGLFHPPPRKCHLMDNPSPARFLAICRAGPHPQRGAASHLCLRRYKGYLFCASQPACFASPLPKPSKRTPLPHSFSPPP